MKPKIFAGGSHAIFDCGLLIRRFGDGGGAIGPAEWFARWHIDAFNAFNAFNPVDANHTHDAYDADYAYDAYLAHHTAKPAVARHDARATGHNHPVL